MTNALIEAYVPQRRRVALTMGSDDAHAVADALVAILPALGQGVKDDCDSTITAYGESDESDLADIARKAWELSVVALTAAQLRDAAAVADRELLEDGVDS